jgi:hypothetical protein
MRFGGRLGAVVDDEPREPGIDWSQMPAPILTRTMVDLDQDLSERLTGRELAREPQVVAKELRMRQQSK